MATAYREGDTGYGVQPAPIRNEIVQAVDADDSVKISELVNFLQSEIEVARDTELDEDRAMAIESYFGLPYGDETEGRSGIVTRDVAEVIDYQVVGILGTVIASGKVVEFEAAGDEEPQTEQGQQAPGTPGTVDYGQQATKAVQYQFMRKQDGYRVLHDSLKAGLMEKIGVVKTFVEKPAPLREEVDVPAGMIEIGPDGPSIEGRTVIDAIGIDKGWQPGTPSTMWRANVEQPRPAIFRDAAVPNENFIISPDALSPDEAVLVGERSRKTLSELVALGFDRDQLETLWGGQSADTVVSDARDSTRSFSQTTMVARNGAVRSVWHFELYPLWDMDGDGIAERLCVHMIGSTILRMADTGEPAIFPVDSQPYSGWSPFPMQHRFVGQSSADKVMDIQRVRTVLLRQGLDSQYQANAPRVTVAQESMTEDTIDDLLTVRPGALIRHRGTAPQPFAVQDTSANSFQAMEMMTAERESRTGVTRHNQGMNPDTLNKTATGMAMLQASGQQIELYIARNYAEFLAKVFSKRYNLMRAHGSPFVMKIDGKAVQIDPRKWPEDIDMTITVGLGTGNKDEKIQLRTGLLGIQQQAMMAGMRGVTEEQIFNNVSALIEDSGLGIPTDYWADPSTLPPAEPKPDPAMAKVQADAATEQAKIQAQQQRDHADAVLKDQQQQMNAALDEKRADQDMQLKSERAALDSQLARDRATEEALLAREKFDFEKELAIERMAFEQEMARKQAPADAAADDDSLPANRPGGDLAE